MSDSLPIPSAVKSDPRSMEMISVWIAKKELHTVLNIGVWHNQNRNEPDAWGILLADVIRHIAGAFEEQFGRDARETRIAVREALERELLDPTSEVRGTFLRKKSDP